MNPSSASPLNFKYEAKRIWRHDHLSEHRTKIKFKLWFGVSVECATTAWNSSMERDLLKPGTRPKHLLWTLFWLKHYQVNDIICDIMTCSEKTFIKYRDIVLEAIKELPVVSASLSPDCHEI